MPHGSDEYSRQLADKESAKGETHCCKINNSGDPIPSLQWRFSETNLPCSQFR